MGSYNFIHPLMKIAIWLKKPYILKMIYIQRWSRWNPRRKLSCMSRRLYVWWFLQQLHERLHLWKFLWQLHNDCNCGDSCGTCTNNCYCGEECPNCSEDCTCGGVSRISLNCSVLAVVLLLFLGVQYSNWKIYRTFFFYTRTSLKLWYASAGRVQLTACVWRMAMWTMDHQ